MAHFIPLKNRKAKELALILLGKFGARMDYQGGLFWIEIWYSCVYSEVRL